MSESNKTPIACPTTVEEIQKGQYFSVKALKKLLENLDDDMPVAIHRVEDSYFESFGENGWKAVKALWESRKISEEREKLMVEFLSDPSKCDPTLHELSINDNGERIMKDYIDAIPAFQAYVSKEKGVDGKRVLVITPHY
jgi:hypothetical protein